MGTQKKTHIRRAILGGLMSTLLLALDMSTKTGWAVFVDGAYKESGALPQVKVPDFNVNKDPQLASAYPFNIVDSTDEVVRQICELIEAKKPDTIVCENTNKGRNRHTQRLLEFLHLTLLKAVRGRYPFQYMDSSQWRKIVELRLSKDDKKNNRDVSAGKKRGRVNKKHLAVRMASDLVGKSFKIKDNDECDAILLGLASVKKNTL